MIPRAARGERNSRSASATTKIMAGTDATKLKKPRYKGAVWNSAGEKTARRASRSNDRSSIQNTAGNAKAIADRTMRHAVSGPTNRERSAAGR